MPATHGNNSAFPTGIVGNNGLSIREYVATAALQGLMACGQLGVGADPKVYVQRAVQLADALLDEVAKTKKPSP
jgi:hypothetical protein